MMRNWWNDGTTERGTVGMMEWALLFIQIATPRTLRMSELSVCVGVCIRMSEWMGVEYDNEWDVEWINEWMMNWCNDAMIECRLLFYQVDAPINLIMSKGVEGEWVTDYVCVWLFLNVWKWVRECEIEFGRVNEWMTEWLNEGMLQGRQMHNYIATPATLRRSDCKCEWLNDRVNQWLTDVVSEWVRVSVWEWESDWLSEKCDWVNDRMIEWMLLFNQLAASTTLITIDSVNDWLTDWVFGL